MAIDIEKVRAAVRKVNQPDEPEELTLEEKVRRAVQKVNIQDVPAPEPLEPGPSLEALPPDFAQLQAEADERERFEALPEVLQKLEKPTATLIMPSGETREIPIDELQPEDLRLMTPDEVADVEALKTEFEIGEFEEELEAEDEFRRQRLLAEAGAPTPAQPDVTAIPAVGAVQVTEAPEEILETEEEQEARAQKQLDEILVDRKKIDLIDIPGLDELDQIDTTKPDAVVALNAKSEAKRITDLKKVLKGDALDVAMNSFIEFITGISTTDAALMAMNKSISNLGAGVDARVLEQMRDRIEEGRLDELTKLYFNVADILPKLAVVGADAVIIGLAIRRFFLKAARQMPELSTFEASRRADVIVRNRALSAAQNRVSKLQSIIDARRQVFKPAVVPGKDIKRLNQLFKFPGRRFSSEGRTFKIPKKKKVPKKKVPTKEEKAIAKQKQVTKFDKQINDPKFKSVLGSELSKDTPKLPLGTKLPKIEPNVPDNIKNIFDDDALKYTDNDLSDPIYFQAKKTLQAWVSRKQVAEFQNARFVNSIARNLTIIEEEAMPFLIERTVVPKALKRPDLAALIKKPTASMKEMEVVIRKNFDEQWTYITKNMDNLSAREIENYVTHIWEIPSSKRKDVVNWFTTKNPFLKKRYIETLEAGIREFGLKPKTLRISEIVHISNTNAIRTTENAKLVKILQQMEDAQGTKLIIAANEAPSGWIMIDHPALQISKIPSNQKKKVLELIEKLGPKQVDDSSKRIMFNLARKDRIPVRVHPDIAPFMKALFERKPLTEFTVVVAGKQRTISPFVAFDLANAVLKKLQLSVSFFHALALTETSVATMGVRKTFKIGLNAVRLWKAVKNKDYSIYGKNYKLAQDGIQHGLQLGASTDVQRGIIQKALKGIEEFSERQMKILGLPWKVLRKADEAWDRALWDYLHNEYKINGYEHLVSQTLRNLPRQTPKAVKEAKEEVAAFINDTFGGQNWERMLVNPGNLQIWQRVLLSPDWTYSTFRQGAALFGIGRIHSIGLRAKFGALFWARAFAYYGTFISATNWALTAWDEKNQTEADGKKFKLKGVSFRKAKEGEALDKNEFRIGDMIINSGSGRFLNQNDPGHITHLFAGRFGDGSKRYIRWGKQFREIPELFYDSYAAQLSPLTATIKKFGGKTAPMVQLITQTFTGSTPSGFKNRELIESTGWKWVYQWAKLFTKTPLPFALRASIDETKEFKISDLAFPSSKGMTFGKARRLMKRALLERNVDFLEKIYRATVENNVNAFQAFKLTQSEIRAEATAETSAEIRRSNLEELGTLRELKAGEKEIKREINKRVVLDNWKAFWKASEARFEIFIMEEDMKDEEMDRSFDFSDFIQKDNRKKGLDD